MKYLFNVKILLLLLVVFSFISVFIGVKPIKILDILNFTQEEFEILGLTRIPRLITIIITGMSLSICGLIMQQLTQNKFISPTTAGTMDCAKFGILIVFIFFSDNSFLIQALIASCFTLLGSMLFIQILRNIKLKDTIFIPLIGIMFGGIISAITTFFAYSLNYIQSIHGWLQGSFTNIIQGNYELIYLALPLFLIAYLFANKLTIVGMGEDMAINFGISYKTVLNLGLIIISIITTVIILTVGVIPFLGLIIPNIVSIYKGDNLKNNLFITALSGALFLLICDIFSRLIIFPFEMPIGITVGIVGSFIFVLLLLRKNNA